MEPFSETLDEATTLRGLRLCGGNCLSSFVTAITGQPHELRFDYRWLTTEGILEFRLGGQLIHSDPAPASPENQFQSARIRIVDPAILSNGIQKLEVCLVPAGPPRVQVANLAFRAETRPVVSIRLVAGESPLEFTWLSVAGRRYQLQTRASLAAGNWTNVGAPIPGTGAALTTTATIDPGQKEGYYRLVVSSE